MSDLIPIRYLYKFTPMSDTDTDTEWVKSYDVQMVDPQEWAKASEVDCELILEAGIVEEEASPDEWIKSDTFGRVQP